MMKKPNFERLMIEHGEAGDTFYTEKADKNITSLASIHKRKVRTERIVAVTASNLLEPEAKCITKVTLL
jgi:hypothetical protein